MDLSQRSNRASIPTRHHLGEKGVRLRKRENLSAHKPHQSTDRARDLQIESTCKAPSSTIIGQHETAASLDHSETCSLPSLEIPFEISCALTLGFTELDEPQPSPIATRNPAQPFTRRQLIPHRLGSAEPRESLL